MMTPRIVAFIACVLVAVAADGGSEQCFDQPTNLAVDRCLSAKLKREEGLITRSTEGITKKLSESERQAFLSEQQAWTNYRDAHCRMAGLMFKGGRMERLIEGSCRVEPARERVH